MSVPAPFVWRCLSGSAVASFPHIAISAVTRQLGGIGTFAAKPNPVLGTRSRSVLPACRDSPKNSKLSGTCGRADQCGIRAAFGLSRAGGYDWRTGTLGAAMGSLALARENGRNSVRKPGYASLTSRDCGHFSHPETPSVCRDCVVELRGFEPLTSAARVPGSARLNSEGTPPHRRLLPPTLCFPPGRSSDLPRRPRRCDDGCPLHCIYPGRCRRT